MLKNIQALSESKRYEFGNNACEKIVGVVCQIFKIYPKNEIQRRHSITFYSRYQRESFCQFEADENNRKCG